MIKRNNELNKVAKQLRREMTRHEKRLWYGFLKELPITVKRQRPIGNYIVDFYIPKSKLVIELDGRQHQAKENEEADILRDNELKSMGLTILRYTNKSIDNSFSDVCEDILNHIGK